MSLSSFQVCEFVVLLLFSRGLMQVSSIFIVVLQTQSPTPHPKIGHQQDMIENENRHCRV